MSIAYIYDQYEGLFEFCERIGFIPTIVTRYLPYNNNSFIRYIVMGGLSSPADSVPIFTRIRGPNLLI